MGYVESYFEEAISIIEKIDKNAVEDLIQLLIKVRQDKGRLFFIGVGGSAGNCSHAVNDFRKIGGFEAYAPTDNVSELSARTNDEGWHTVFAEWLKGSNLNEKDAVFVFSVGGGDKEKDISTNIVNALECAQERNAKIVGVVGRNGGYTAKVSDICIIVPTVNPDTITPHTESFHAVVWHLIVSDPRIMQMKNKWESTAAAL